MVIVSGTFSCWNEANVDKQVLNDTVSSNKSDILMRCGIIFQTIGVIHDVIDGGDG